MASQVLALLPTFQVDFILWAAQNALQIAQTFEILLAAQMPKVYCSFLGLPNFFLGGFSFLFGVGEAGWEGASINNLPSYLLY